MQPSTLLGWPTHGRSGVRQLRARRDMVRDHYLPHARTYAADGLHYYNRVVALYERELHDLAARIAQKTRAA